MSVPGTDKKVGKAVLDALAREHTYHPLVGGCRALTGLRLLPNRQSFPDCLGGAPNVDLAKLPDLKDMSPKSITKNVIGAYTRGTIGLRSGDPKADGWPSASPAAYPPRSQPSTRSARTRGKTAARPPSSLELVADLHSHPQAEVRV